MNVNLSLFLFKCRKRPLKETDHKLTRCLLLYLDLELFTPHRDIFTDNNNFRRSYVGVFQSLHNRLTYS